MPEGENYKPDIGTTPGGGSTCKEEENVDITHENWEEFERDIRETGIQETIHDDDGVLRTIITKSGTRYDVSPQTWKQVVEQGLIKTVLGQRVNS